MYNYSFLITSLIIVLMPGSGVVYTISTGLTKGKKSSIFAAIGCTMGIIPHLCVSILLYSLVLKANEQVFFVFKIAGVLYLLYLGLGMILSKEELDLDASFEGYKAKSIMSRAVLINLLNPKLTIFFFSFLPQYVSPNSNNYILESIFLGLIFMILTLIVFILYGLLAGTMKDIIIKSPKTLRRVQQLFGIIFIVFAVNLAFGSI